VTLATTVALTGSAATIGSTFDVRDNKRVSLAVSWAKHADETLLTIDVQGTLDASTWFTLPVVVDGAATITSGVAAAALGALKYTRTVTGTVHIPVEVYGARSIRVQATSATSGSRGTLSIVAVGDQS
jgi:hypothetical protein